MRLDFLLFSCKTFKITRNLNNSYLYKIGFYYFSMLVMSTTANI